MDAPTQSLRLDSARMQALSALVRKHHRMVDLFGSRPLPSAADKARHLTPHTAAGADCPAHLQLEGQSSAGQLQTQSSDRALRRNAGRNGAAITLADAGRSQTQAPRSRAVAAAGRRKAAAKLGAIDRNVRTIFGQDLSARNRSSDWAMAEPTPDADCPRETI